jgi:nucleotide-binding universal stress UspA family protein
MIRSLLVPLDGSQFGEHALPLALAIARRAGATLQLLQVLPPLASIYSEAPLFLEDSLAVRFRERQREAVRAYLDGVVKRVGSFSPVAVGGIIREGEVAATIEDQVVSTGVDLVVMTTHGRGPLGRLWLGSVADQLVRRVPVPLLLVRPREGSPDLADEPVLRHILLPLDGSALAEEMLGPAVEIGRLMGADFSLLRALPPRLVAYPTGPAGLGAPSVLLPEADPTGGLRPEAEEYLEGVAERLRAQGLRVRTRVIPGRPPAAAILQEAVPPAFDLVALETHGRHGLSRLVLGSVADKVVRGAAVPVLVHRALAS